MNKKDDGSRVSLHLRIWKTLYDTGLEAIALKRSFFQSFLLSQETGRPLRVNRAEQAAFVELRYEYFTALFAHAAYWVNLASDNQDDLMRFLHKEIERARSFEFTHYVLHLGNVTDGKNKMQGLDLAARCLNLITKNNQGPKVVLENGAQINKALGTDFEDFELLLKKLDHPDRIWFCLDTAHAYAAGYDLSIHNEYERLMKDVDEAMSFNRLALIHLNDSAEPLGSQKDRHEVPGKGQMGPAVFQRLVNDERISCVPLLLELPVLNLEDQKNALALVESWLL